MLPDSYGRADGRRCVRMSLVMKDREVILDVLGRVARRLWVNRALQEIGFGLSVALFSLVAFQLVRPAFADGGFSALYVVAIALAVCGCVGYALWRVTRRATLRHAAGAADWSERLKDELKTAYWLVTRNDASAFGELQVERAAQTAQRLDPRRIVPARAPPDLLVAGVLALLLMGTSGLAPRPSLSWDAVRAGEAESLASLRAMLAEGPEDERLQRLDKALAVLERAGASPEQWQRAAAQARDAVDEANVRAVAARESLARVAAAMRGRTELEEAGRALEQGRTIEALEMLKALASPDAGAGPGEDANGAAHADRGDRDPEWGSEEAIGDLRHQTARVNEDALNKVLKSIEDAQNALETQRRAAEVRRRMEDFLAATSQRSALTASRFGSRASAPNPTPAPETGNADLRGGTMYRQGAVARDDADNAQEGSRTGAASGHSEALELEGARTERLDAKLRLETLRAQDMVGDGGERGEQTTWYYLPTEGGAAKTAFAQLRGGERFASAGTMNTARVPPHSRRAVRDYFINIHESAGK